MQFLHRDQAETGGSDPLEQLVAGKPANHGQGEQQRSEQFRGTEKPGPAESVATPGRPVMRP